MSLLDEYRHKLEAQFEEHKSRLNVLKAKAKKVAAQSKIVGYQELEKADIHLDQVKARLKELKGAGGHALDELKSGMHKALADLKASTQKAAQHFTDAKPAAKKGSAKSRPAKAKAAAKLVRHPKAVKRSVRAKSKGR
jgi:hypothetical protein